MPIYGNANPKMVQIRSQPSQKEYWQEMLYEWLLLHCQAVNDCLNRLSSISNFQLMATCMDTLLMNVNDLLQPGSGGFLRNGRPCFSLGPCSCALQSLPLVLLRRS